MLFLAGREGNGVVDDAVRTMRPDRDGPPSRRDPNTHPSGGRPSIGDGPSLSMDTICVTQRRRRESGWRRRRRCRMSRPVAPGHADGDRERLTPDRTYHFALKSRTTRGLGRPFRIRQREASRSCVAFPTPFSSNHPRLSRTTGPILLSDVAGSRNPAEAAGSRARRDPVLHGPARAQHLGSSISDLTPLQGLTN